MIKVSNIDEKSKFQELAYIIRCMWTLKKRNHFKVYVYIRERMREKNVKTTNFVKLGMHQQLNHLCFLMKLKITPRYMFHEQVTNWQTKLKESI